MKLSEYFLQDTKIKIAILQTLHENGLRELHEFSVWKSDEFDDEKRTRENRKKETLSNLCSQVGTILPADNFMSFPMLSGAPLMLQPYRLSRVELQPIA